MINPEFRRNVWLEMTTHRVVGMPMVLGALFFLTWLVSGRQVTEAMASAAFFISGGLLLLWGASQAAESILSEVRGRTWENQRMSAMASWEMAWGKLLGGTVYAWYGAAICIPVYLIASPDEPLLRIKHVVLLLLCALFAQSMALLAGLQMLSKDRSVVRSQATLYALFGLIVSWPLLMMGLEGKEHVEWYGISLTSLDFALASGVFFGGWGMVGIYRLMRAELQVANGILVWVLFVCWLTGYLAGFMDEVVTLKWSVTSTRLLIASLVVLSLTYLMIFVESKDPVTFSRLKRALATGDWRRIDRNLPCWLATLAMALIVCVLLALTFPAERGLGSSLFFISLFLFALRDVAIVLWCNFSRQRKRSDMTAILYLVILYLLLPAITGAMGLDSLDVLFYPQWMDQVVAGALLAALQSGIFLWLAIRRWRQNYGVTRIIHE